MLKQLALGAAVALSMAGFAFTNSAAAQTAVPFALDWKFEGPSAPYFAAIDNGHFKAEGLDVEVSALKGTNLEELLDQITLQAELLELRSNTRRFP